MQACEIVSVAHGALLLMGGMAVGIAAAVFVSILAVGLCEALLVLLQQLNWNIQRRAAVLLGKKLRAQARNAKRRPG
jgi:hypothetical protein